MEEQNASEVQINDLCTLADILASQQRLLTEIRQLETYIEAVAQELTIRLPREDNCCRQKENLLETGRKKFNIHPKKGLEYLMQQGLVKDTPQDIALFIYQTKGLNKSGIGDYLGEGIEFNIHVLDDFVALHTFEGQTLVEALRKFLWSFRLPGEAQKIDRMMERFARHYCGENPGVFRSDDACYVLSFSVIMLNTSLHNPSVKDKPTLEQFVSMNRGINDGGDFPRELLRSLYENIKQLPFKFPDDGADDLMLLFENPEREGCLQKQGRRFGRWKERRFVLTGNCLYCFERAADKEPQAVIALENVQVREVEDSRRKFCFEIISTGEDAIKSTKKRSTKKIVQGKRKIYRFSASSDGEMNKWITSIQNSIIQSPFHDVITAKKRKARKQ